MKFLCTLHQVQFDSAAAAGCTPENSKIAKLAECPVCMRIRMDALSDEVARLREQNEHLIAAIEIKQKRLTLERK